MTNFFFSPYGVLPGEYKDKGLNDETVMKHWRPADTEADRITSFQSWQQSLLDQIAQKIWPIYDPRTDSWMGSAVQTATALTGFELQVMIQEFITPNRTLDAHPNSALSNQKIENHLAHYQYEDEKAPGYNFRQYDRTLNDSEEKLLLHQMLSAVTSNSLGVGEKIAGHFWFKSQLQRPRPLHAALRLNLEENFVSELSSRGQHPSIVSGHCLQGIMMCCSVLENWRLNDPNLDTNRVESLAQYMVDVGDRRVFAGVHYPSDNIASWAVALSLIPEVFDEANEIADFVRNAIVEKSIVFEVIARNYFGEPRASSAIELLSMYGLAKVAV